MCGIVGRWNFKSGALVEESYLESACQKILHRGPDEGGIYISGDLGLGHRRLSILDLAHGRQPWSVNNLGVHLVYNGEIYNYCQLRAELEADGCIFKTSCDTELIPHLYQKYGHRFPEYLNGMFAIVLWDDRRRCLVLVRDRFGKKPLLYALTEHGITFASEMQALLEDTSIGNRLELTAIDSYLSLGYVPNSMSVFEGVEKMPPATTMVVTAAGEISKFRYWAINTGRQNNICQGEALEQLDSLVHDATKIRLASDVPIGAFLSGGIDSSLIAAVMAANSTETISTYTIGFSDSAFDEREHAQSVASYIGSHHSDELVNMEGISILPQLQRHYGEPFGDASAIPTYYLCQSVRKNSTVAISGDGGDEIFLGYTAYRRMWYREMLQLAIKILPIKAYLQNRSRGQKRRLSSRHHRLLNTLCEASLPLYERFSRIRCVFSPFERQALYSNELVGLSAGENGVERLIEGLFDRYQGLPVLKAASMVDQNSYLVDDILAKVDIASMASSLEVRAPLLDYRIAEFAATLPQKLNFQMGGGKLLLKALARKHLPAEILDRPKQGFGVPVARWINNGLEGYVRQNLLESNTVFGHLFDRGEIELLISEHKAGRGNFGNKLWLLLCLSVWFNEYRPSL